MINQSGSVVVLGVRPEFRTVIVARQQDLAVGLRCATLVKVAVVVGITMAVVASLERLVAEDECATTVAKSVLHLGMKRSISNVGLRNSRVGRQTQPTGARNYFSMRVCAAHHSVTARRLLYKVPAAGASLPERGHEGLELLLGLSFREGSVAVEVERRAQPPH